MTEKYPSIKQLLGRLATLLAVSFALLFTVIFALSNHAAKLAEKSEQELLPSIHEHQRAALNLERLERMGDLVAYGGDISLIRKNALSAQVLAFQPSFDFNEATRRSVRKSYLLIKQLRVSRQRLLLMQKTGSDNSEIKQLLDLEDKLQMQWHEEKQGMFELQNQIISAATRLQTESLQQISLTQKQILIVGGCGVTALLIVLASIGRQMVKHLIRPISRASHAMLAIESGQEYQLEKTRYEETSLIYHAVERLSATVQTLHDLATTDEMTQCYNRRHFVNLARDMLNKAQENDQPLSIVMLDIDHFKKVNDQYGHATGDTTLKYFALWLKENLPDNGHAGRLGGEEFALLLPGLSESEATDLSENIRKSIASQSQDCPDIPGITVSMGVKGRVGKQDAIDGLLSKADKALYLAKACGRNQVISYSTLKSNQVVTDDYRRSPVSSVG